MPEVIAPPAEAPAAASASAAPAPAAASASPAPAPAAGAPAAGPAPAPSGAPAAPAPAPIATKWQDGWREDMAGTLPETASEDEKAEHAKLLTRLKRFNTPADAAKALREQDKLISSGALKKALPKNPTEAQIAEWRKDNGVPETPDKYDLGVPKDVDLNEHDQTMLSEWAAQAHAANAPPELAKAGAAAYLKVRAAVADQMQQANAAAKKGTEDDLRAEWGADYRTNIDGLDSMINHLGGEFSEALLNARTADGVQLLNHPAVVRALAGHARELGFVGATVVPSGSDIGKGIEDEIKGIEASMFKADGTRDQAYWGNDKVQKRYSDLLQAKSRRDGKA